MRAGQKLLITLGFAVSVAASGQAASAQDIRIGFVLPELSNEAILDLDIGARARAEQLGNVEILTTGSYSGEDQAAAVENYIAAGVDILAYDTIDAAAVGPAIVKANKAGIIVICVFSCGSTGEQVTFMSADWTGERPQGRPVDVEDAGQGRCRGPRRGEPKHGRGHRIDAGGSRRGWPRAALRRSSLSRQP